jgi:hypothetical protein
MDFADVLYPTHRANFPTDIIRDRDDSQLCTMTSGSPTKLLYDLS